MGLWWKSLKGRLAVYLYPLCSLVALEFLMRSLTSSEGTLAFIGPTLAAIGVSFALTLTVKRPMTKEQQKEKLRERQGRIPQHILNMLDTLVDARDELEKGKISIEVEEESDHLLAGWLLTTLIFTPVWAYALYLSIKFPNSLWWLIPSSCWPGIFNYVLGFGLSELRERKV